MYWTLVKIGLIRKRLRTFLTIMSMFIAFWLYGTLNTFSGVFAGGVDGLSAENIMVMPGMICWKATLFSCFFY